MLRHSPSETAQSITYVMVCLSYRGYWTSQGRPSKIGIAKDAAAALSWIKTDHYSKANQNSHGTKNQLIPVILWGQSIGAGVATNLAAQHELFTESLDLKALILETPFISIRAMLETIYPQKWLPYRHLWPFLWNHLDSLNTLGLLAKRTAKSGLKLPDILILEAEKDELVPNSHGDSLEKRCLDLGLNIRKKIIHGALHTGVMDRSEGRTAVVEAIRKAARDPAPDVR
jgi:alpha-beta hydrolase superfamily lysophospholipase